MKDKDRYVIVITSTIGSANARLGELDATDWHLIGLDQQFAL